MKVKKISIVKLNFLGIDSIKFCEPMLKSQGHEEIWKELKKNIPVYEKLDRDNLISAYILVGLDFFFIGHWLTGMRLCLAFLRM